MHLGKTNPKFEYVMRLKNDEFVIINKCTAEKDLGVIFDYKLSFDAHTYTKKLLIELIGCSV